MIYDEDNASAKVCIDYNQALEVQKVKRIIISVAIVLEILLITLILQGCFTPYPAIGTPERESRDRELQEQLRDMRRGY